jgi:hypothetical protein
MKAIVEALPYQQMEPDFSRNPDVCILAKRGECYLIYFVSGLPLAFELSGDGPYKLDGVDPWDMKVQPMGAADPGPFRFTPPKPDFAIRLTKYAPDEKK